MKPKLTIDTRERDRQIAERREKFRLPVLALQVADHHRRLFRLGFESVARSIAK